MVVDHHHLVGQAGELLGKDADRGRAAAQAHPHFGHTINHRRLAGLNLELCATVDLQIHRAAIAQRLHRLDRDAALTFAAAGQVVHAAQAQHLRAIFRGADVTDDFALTAHAGLLRAEPAVSVDLQFEAAIAEDALGDDGDHVHAVGLRRDDEGRRFVIGIGGRGAYRGDEIVLAVVYRGRLGRRQKRHHPGALIGGAAAPQHQQWIDPHQHAVAIGIAVTGADLAIADLAQHRAGIALDLVRRHAGVAGGRPGRSGRVSGRYRLGRQGRGLDRHGRQGRRFAQSIGVQMRRHAQVRIGLFSSETGQ